MPSVAPDKFFSPAATTGLLCGFRLLAGFCPTRALRYGHLLSASCRQFPTRASPFFAARAVTRYPFKRGNRLIEPIQFVSSFFSLAS
jgi:hypothetical protein